MAAWFEAGKARWPQLSCDFADFQRVATIYLQKPPAEAAPNAGDMYLAASVLGGSTGAISAFEQHCLRPAQAALTKMGLARSSFDDVLQVAREKLLLPTEHPRLIDMAGTGDLRAICRVVVVRSGLNMLRAMRPTEELEDNHIASHLATRDDPGARAEQKDATQLLTDSLRVAVAALSPRDKTLLRLHVFHRLSIDELGRMYDVHRATAARWITNIHSRLEAATRAELKRRLATRADHLPSLLALADRSLAAGFSAVWQEVPSASPALSPSARVGTLPNH